MSRKRSMLAGLVVVVAVVTAGCGARQTDDTPSQQVTPAPNQGVPTPTAKPATLASANAKFLESKLVNSDKTEQALALIPDLRAGKWSSSAALPAGSTLSIDEKSFKVAKDGYATVNATVTGSVEGEFILHLAFIDGQWLIFQTDQKR